MPDSSGAAWLIEWVCDFAGVRPVHENLSPGVECVRRTWGDQNWLFILNHSSKKVGITLSHPSCDLITGEQTDGTLDLDSLGVAIIEQPA